MLHDTDNQHDCFAVRNPPFSIMEKAFHSKGGVDIVLACVCILAKRDTAQHTQCNRTLLGLVNTNYLSLYLLQIVLVKTVWPGFSHP